MFVKYIILILVLLTSVSAFALPTCSKNGTRIIYTNGVITTKEKAEHALDKILSLKDSNNLTIIASIDKNGIQDPIVAYNYTEGPAKDVLEATVQRLPKNYLKALNVTNAYDGFSRYIHGDLIELIPEDIKNSIIESEIQIISSFTQVYFNSELYEKTINEGFPHYLNAIQKKEKILAISHSQGSLFMKDFYDLLPESDYKRKFFSGFQVASVLGNEMNSHFGYATNSKDKVVNSVRLAIGVLPANLDTPLIISTSGTSDLFINHGILTTYLYDSSLKEQVIQNLIKAAQLLESNCNKAEIKVIEKKGLKVTFDSTDPEDIDVADLTYEWNFGDELITQTNSKTISHTYAKPGSYLITLKVINNDGDTDSKNIVIQVLAPPKAIINFTKNNLVVNFDSTGNTDLTGLTYSWNFGDGQTSALKAPTHNYSQAGTYYVSLIVTDSYGASDSKIVSISVQGNGSSVRFCNTGLLGNVMNFYIDGVEPFSLQHIFPASGDNYDPHTCECKTIQIPKNQRLNMYVDGTNFTGINLALTPYSGTIYGYDHNQTFYTDTSVVDGVFQIRISGGASFQAVVRCGVYDNGIIINK